MPTLAAMPASSDDARPRPVDRLLLCASPIHERTAEASAYGVCADDCDAAGRGFESISRFGSALHDGDRILGAVEAVLKDGPLKGTKVEIEAVEGRPPSTIDVSDVEGVLARYCLAEWTQTGMSADYTFLYPV